MPASLVVLDGGGEMKLALVLLTVLALFLADRLVRVENQRYALLVGMCTVDPRW